MSYQDNGEIYIRTFTPEELQEAIKIADSYDVGLRLHFANENVSASNVYADPDILEVLVQNICDKVPNCLIVYCISGYESYTGASDYYIAIKYPSENTDICIAEVDETWKSKPVYIGNGFKSPQEVFSYVKKAGGKIKAPQRIDILEIFGKKVDRSNLNVKNLVIEGGKKAIDAYEFAGEEIESIVFSDSVKKIGKEAFRGCEKLKEIVVPSTIKEIGADAFADCSNLVKVIIEDGVEKISDGAFSGCSKLKEVVLPQKLEKLGKRTFQECRSLVNIIVPKGITKIDNYVFENCKSLKNVTFLDTVTEIGIKAFAKCKALVDFRIPATVPVEKIGKNAFNQAKVAK